jgi:hypothetical protein
VNIELFIITNMRFIIVFLCCFVLILAVSAAAERSVSGLTVPDLDAGSEYADEYVEERPVAPSPVPKRLLERPRSGERLTPPAAPKALYRSATQQTAFENLNPAGAVIPEGILEDSDTVPYTDVPLPPHRWQGLLQRRQPPVIMDDGSYYVADNSPQAAETLPFQTETAGLSADDTAAMPGYYPVPVMPTFGTGTLDNLQFFAGTNTFKNTLSQGRGSFALSEGLNWSTPLTASGAVTAQGGVRTNQADMYDKKYGRNQMFYTAAVFKRYDSKPLQGGAALDWMDDRIRLYSNEYDLPRRTYRFRQMRAEISMRSFRGLEYGFQGGFNLNKKSTDIFETSQELLLQSYYLLFGRYMLPCGGQVEGKIGATEWGDILAGCNGQAAISSRLAVTGGVTFLSPHEGRRWRGNDREAWSVSLGVIFYFRGGANNFANNMNRPFFDIAGNDSMFLRER